MMSDQQTKNYRERFDALVKKFGVEIPIPLQTNEALAIGASIQGTEAWLMSKMNLLSETIEEYETGWGMSDEEMEALLTQWEGYELPAPEARAELEQQAAEQKQRFDAYDKANPDMFRLKRR